ncbi:DUF3169 family protein [Streptococcus pneumoniae]
MKNKKRVNVFLFLFLLGCGISGYFVGCGIASYFVGYEIGSGSLFKEIFHMLLTLEWYVYLAQVASLVFLGMTFYLLHRSRLEAIAYQKAEEEDDEDKMDQFYKSAHKKLEYGTITYNIYSVSMIFSLFGAFYMIAVDFAQFWVLLVSFIIYLSLFFLTPYYRKTLKMVRNYDFPKFAMPEDALNLIRSYDEGEREANYENSFMTLFRLNQIILPALYIILDVISLALQEVQLTAFLIVAFIHIYINIREIPMIKKYFK